MTDILIQICTGGISIIIIFKILDYIFDNYEISPELKAQLVEIIIKTNMLSLFESLRVYVLNLINVLFTKKHFSWACFKRSCLASALFILLLHALYFFGHTYFWSKISWGQVLPFCTYFLLFFVLYNLLDFFLLWKTRKTFEYSGKKKTKFTVYILLFDFITSFIYGFVKYWVVMLILTHQLPDVNYFFKNVITVTPPKGYPAEDAIIQGLFFFGSFIYSIFLFLYYLAVYLCRKAVFVNRFKNLLTRISNVKDEPVKFLKMVFGILIFTVVCITLIIQSIF